jgi:uncharacterized protein YwgA
MSLKDTKRVAAIVSDAGGRIIGRTKLQKVAYLLHVTGLEPGFSFSYKHYGPYSEDLANAARVGSFLGELREFESPASWGGSYSTYTAELATTSPESRRQLAKLAAAADAVELELAATAVFLAREGYPDAWAETARRKPEKSENGRIEKAKELLRALSQISVPAPLPRIA